MNNGNENEAEDKKIDKKIYDINRLRHKHK